MRRGKEEAGREKGTRTPRKTSDLGSRPRYSRTEKDRPMTHQIRKRCCMTRRSRGGECKNVSRSNRESRRDRSRISFGPDDTWITAGTKPLKATVGIEAGVSGFRGDLTRQAQPFVSSAGIFPGTSALSSLQQHDLGSAAFRQQAAPSRETAQVGSGIPRVKLRRRMSPCVKRFMFYIERLKSN